MQRFQFVPRRTPHQLSDRKLIQSVVTDSASLRPLQRVVQSASRITTFRYLRHGLVAFSIPATLLAGTVLPAAPHADRIGESAALLTAVPAANDSFSPVSTSEAFAYQGAMALGSPDTTDENPARVAMPSHDAAEMVRQYIGARYRYGGASPRGFDCSGLTMYVYRQLGIDLPHRASAQFNKRFGQPVEIIEELAPGDLVFFERTTKRRGITHVALYVGDGMMVSANSPRTGVQHVSIYSSYWKTRFAGGLRPYR